MTRAQRAKARITCRRCHAVPGKPCMRNRRKIGNSSIVMPGSPMIGVHAERLADLGEASPAKTLVERTEEARKHWCSDCGANAGQKCIDLRLAKQLKAVEIDSVHPARMRKAGS
jgi:hypothetical protein